MVLRMEQGTLLQHQLPIHPDYSGLPIETGCADHCGQTPSQESYNQHAVVDTIRRDNTLGQHLPSSYHFAASQSNGTTRFVTDRAVGDAGSYQPTGNFTESSSGSISTSPSSAASSLAYTSYPGSHHYTSIQQFPAAVQLPQGFVQSTYSGARSSSMLDNSTQSMLPPPTRSSLSGLTNASDRDTLHGSSTPYLSRTPLSSAGFPNYNYPETPRSVIQATAQLSLSPGGSPYSTSHMANTSQHSYGTTAVECANFPWSDLEALVDMNCDGQLLVPKISAKVEKGFFQAPQPEKRWTCYRRNYFSVACSFELRPNVSNGRITIRRNNVLEQVQAMGMRLSAAVDGKDGKNIELVQHTPKRDAGPKTKIDICKVAPTPCTGRADQSMHPHYQVGLTSYHNVGQLPGPYLPLQHIPEADAQPGAAQDGSTQYAYGAPGQTPLLGGQGTTHTFERVQFKQATANNGKRRATQQYFHLIVELYADIRKEGSENPSWIKVAQRVSEKIVVRGRSPSHYSNEKGEGPHGVSGRGSAGSVGYGSGGASYGSMNAGGFRGLTNVYGNTNPYRRNDLQYSDHGSQSDSSGSSLEEGPMETTYQADSVMSEAERLALHERYSYYPSTLYENVHQNGSMLPPLTKLDGNARYLNDPKHYAVKAEYSDAIAGAQYEVNNCGRFQGVDTSRGYFPDLQARF
ncbi:hypothetical protein AMS68_006733 [Peltaster fructicola]|uniref:NDT80 domain-containing protein n=1 Tax=Peltaster fructicola TaxID=286661 RepID=A0A6H0Y2P2_9PEZI|nr:hypothetical protein AMS68_006733 [Peltaster fructicola]